MCGYLDQVEEFIYFGDRNEREGNRLSAEKEKAKVMTSCSRVDDVAGLIAQLCNSPPSLH